ncbi:MAG TPA: aminotransferase class I/II-fold pyridoxal phosphate-dependent enzyme [Myxococcota bacterium]|nr:aminotransferase class I/II-fold pyridoxal phosphate-dependent enzyme [Myxococcota bacterium]
MSIPKPSGSATPIRGQRAAEIAQSIEAAIAAGRLAPGDKLPAVRALAARLGVSPATVNAAYRALRGRALVAAAGRRGTAVRGRPALRTALAPTVPAGALDLATGNPDPALLAPLRRALSRIDPTPHLYTEDHELPALRRLAERDFAADGIPAEHLAVVSGALDGIERVLEAHLRPGDRVAVEDPGFSSVLDLVAALGLEGVPVALDDRGILPDALAGALARNVRALIVTPRAQNPTGAAFDPARAAALRRTLRAHPQLLVVEDDHAGAVAGAPACTLWERGRERWAVVRSTSKTHGPDLRLALLAGDPVTIGRVAGRQRMGFRWVSHLLQRLVADLEADPESRRRLRRAARAYGERRSALVAALAQRGIEAHGRSGLNVWIPVPEEVAAVQRLLDAGYAVGAGERFRIESAPAIRITVSRLPVAAVSALADAIAACLRPDRGSAAA